MKLPTPYFDLLRQHFHIDPKSTHICSKGYISGDPSPAETSGTRLCEALLVAADVVPSRQAIAELANRAQNADQRRALGLGRFGFRADMCEHGMARGAADLAHFLEEQWGRATKFARPNAARTDLANAIGEIEQIGADEIKKRLHKMLGVIGFMGIDGQKVRAHIDLWAENVCLGEEKWSAAQAQAYWSCEKIFFWKLD